MDAIEPIEITTPTHKIIILLRSAEMQIRGWHRPDLDAMHQNWHYYQTVDGGIWHFRKEHIEGVYQVNA